MNTLHYRYIGSTIADADAALLAVLTYNNSIDGFLPTLQALLGPDITIDEQYIQKISPVRLRALRQAVGRAGTAELPNAPINSALTITKYTEFAERWGIGSWHQPGLPADAMQDSGHWNAAILTAIDASLGDLLTTSIAFPMGDPVGALGPVLFAEGDPHRVNTIRDIQPQATIRTMRRRTVHVGI